MATLPPKSNFTDTNVKQGGFRAALDQLRDYLAGLLGEQGTAAQARATLGLGALATLSEVPAAALAPGERMTTANVLGATAGAAVGGVGTYALLWRTDVAETLPGSTRPGSGLRYAAGTGASNVAPAGTWRCMGYTANNQTTSLRITLWLRIA